MSHILITKERQASRSQPHNIMDKLINFLEENLNPTKLSWCNETIYQNEERTVLFSLEENGLKTQCESESSNGYFRYDDFLEEDLIEKVETLIKLNS